MSYLKRIGQLTYWFDVQALAFSETAFWIFVGWLGLITIAFIILRILVHRKAANIFVMRYLARVSRGVLTYGVVSALFLFFRTQEAVVIGMRFWYALASVIFIAWLMVITIKFRRRYEGERKAYEERLRRESYFPKSRK